MSFLQACSGGFNIYIFALKFNMAKQYLINHPVLIKSIALSIESFIASCGQYG